MKKTAVYWLHLIEHYEPDKKGYIGVSTEVDSRYKEHIRLLKNGHHDNIHLTHAYLRYGSRILMSVIEEGDEKYCYLKEKEFRPNWNIGWNIAPGGFSPPKMLRENLTEGRIEDLRNRWTGENNPHYNKPKSKEWKIEHSQKLAQTWEIIHPNGAKEVINNLHEFNKRHGLHSSLMCWVAQGKHKQHKGFRVRKVNDG